ncbi:MAG TPA: hypothetical protein VK512_20090 [Xanthobacteraceae bacterium]|nr:hypothetical protein [Xanthobacteraceae bacterium]
MVVPTDAMPAPQDPQRNRPDSGRFGARDCAAPAWLRCALIACAACQVASSTMHLFLPLCVLLL